MSPDVPVDLLAEIKADTATPDQFQMELRGYEVAKLVGGRWVQVSNWRPTNWGLNGALAACAWLNDRWPELTYAVRPVVSMLPPAPPSTPSEELHLEADADPGPPIADDDIPTEEA